MRVLHQAGRALGAPDDVVDIVGAARLLAATGKDLGPVGVFVGDAEVVKDVAVLFAGPRLAAADADALDRRFVAHDPRGFVEAMDVLLGVVIAREPSEVEPVAVLVFHLAPLGIAAAMPEPAVR